MLPSPRGDEVLLPPLNPKTGLKLLPSPCGDKLFQSVTTVQSDTELVTVPLRG